MDIELSLEQINFIFSLLDKELKRNGLSSLIKVVDMYNMLMDAKKANETKLKKDTKSAV